MLEKIEAAWLEPEIDTDHNAAEAVGIWLYAGGVMEPRHAFRH